VERVLSVVTHNARAWRGENIKLFTELRFTYEVRHMLHICFLITFYFLLITGVCENILD
jgi:hypothetical protein